MTDTIYILLPVHNRREVTRRFIDCLTVQSYADYHLVLIDDGSSDGTAEMVKERIRPLTVITGAGDWWWAGSLQSGYEWIKARNLPASDVILIANDDIEFEKDFLEAGVTFLRQDKKTFLLARCFDKKDNSLVDAGVHIDWKRFTFEQPSEQKKINCLSTRGLFFRVEDFLQVGGFHPVLLPHYASDYEFTIRAGRKGMKLMTHPTVKLWLDQSTTGYHTVERTSFKSAIKKVLLVKSSINPIVLSTFVALACPWLWKVPCWLRILSRSFSKGSSLLLKR